MVTVKQLVVSHVIAVAAGAAIVGMLGWQNADAKAKSSNDEAIATIIRLSEKHPVHPIAIPPDGNVFVIDPACFGWVVAPSGFTSPAVSPLVDGKALYINFRLPSMSGPIESQSLAHALYAGLWRAKDAKAGQPDITIEDVQRRRRELQEQGAKK